MRTKRMFFMYGSLLATGIIVFAYFLDSLTFSKTSQRRRYQKMTNVRAIKDAAWHLIGQNLSLIYTGNKTDFSATKSYNQSSGAHSSVIKTVNVSHLQDSEVKVVYKPKYIHLKKHEFVKPIVNVVKVNYTELALADMAGFGIDKRSPFLSYARYQLLKAVIFNPPQKDRFNDQEEASFKNPVLLSHHFQPPERIPTNINVCKDSTPFLLIVILSVPTNRLLRMTIRQTWGSIAQSNIWPNSRLNGMTKILFVLGEENVSPSLFDVVNQEQLEYNDMLLLNMMEDYYKLTFKILAALHWVNDHCHGVRYVLKADQDSFVNIPFLIDFLLIYKEKLRKSVFGFMYNHPWVSRGGKWKLSHDEYPFNNYPSYASGSSYLISGDAVGPILNAVKYFAPIPIEDAYVTGILAKIARLTRHHTSAMAVMGDVYWGRGFPHMCEFYTTRFSLTDCSAEMFDRMWIAAEVNYCGSSYSRGLNIR